MKNLKVVFVSNWWANPYMDSLIENLASQGVQVEPCNWGMIFLPQILKQWKLDILHLHELRGFLVGKSNLSRLVKLLIFLIQILILRVLGVKVVWTVHEWKDKLGEGRHEIPASTATIVGKCIDAIITHCNTVKEEIVTTFQLEDKNKVFVVPHGNYIGCYENKINQLAARKILDIPTENFVFLLFGGLYRHKGVLELIDAFQGLPQNRLSLLIAGNPNEDQLDALITSKIRDYQNILFVPKRIPDEDIQIYMNACNCVVVPYKVFTTSGVAILSMSFGRACIAPDIGFFKDVLDPFGSFLYDSADETSLLYAMKCAIEKRAEILDMGNHNLKLAEQWNWNDVTEETFKIYQMCLSSSYSHPKLS